MTYLIRKANAADPKDLGGLLEAYLQETYQGAWGGSVEVLLHDMTDGKVSLTIAESIGGEIIGFIAYIETYDLHWCMRGVEVIDFYVSPPYRGHGPSVHLVAGLAGEVLERGGSFIKGGAVDDPVVRRLYGKIAAHHGNGEAYVSGRAFRHLARLAGKSLRDIVRNLPKPEWNIEP